MSAGTLSKSVSSAQEVACWPSRRGEVNQAIAANLKRLRRARGWSIAMLARKCEELGANHLTVSSLGNIERGMNDPGASKRANREVTAEEFFMFTRMYKVSTDELAGFVDCAACSGTPPAGFSCNSCGRSA